MKMLNVRFSDTQQLKIEDVVDTLGIDFSKISRAAMKLGIEEIVATAAVDPSRAKELVLVNDALSK